MPPVSEIFPHIDQLFVNMIDHHRPIVKSAPLILSILLLLSSLFSANAQDVAAGKTLFSNKCATCHGVHTQITGPALFDVEKRVGDKAKLHAWIRNNRAVLATNDPYFTGVFKAFGGQAMNLFPELTDGDIDNILAYIQSVPPPGTVKDGGGGGGGETKGQTSDNALIFGILTLILAVITMILLQVNSNLRKLADDKEGIPAHEPIPFYRNKTYIALGTIILFIIGGYYTIQGAVGLGRSKNYQPVQPIYFSHKVHAGVNQINCMYCHSGAWDSKHVGIPSINVCMNCHQTITTYAGAPLVHEDGHTVDGSEEIKKLHKAAGFTPGPGAVWDPAKGTAIEWIKIHNLPDHVYFNHSQHTRVGKVQCQTCHGEITAMDEVKQFADLSMGWCINCHRTTKVDFPDSTGKGGNQFYSIYVKYHNDLKNRSKDSITVHDIGGTECQKCHY